MKSTKKSLIASALSLVLCISMLLGTTYAWFTDSVTSGKNKIVAGNLDVDLVMWDDANTVDGYRSIANEEGAIFGEGSIAQNNHAETLWEPGKTQIVYLGVRNNGNLALKYNVWLAVNGDLAKKLGDETVDSALEYAIIDGATYAANHEALEGADWTAVKAAAADANKGDVKEGSYKAAEGGVLDEIAKGTEGETDYFVLAVHMKEDAGNAYRNKDVTIDVTVVAGQVTAEKDSFDDQYDAEAPYAEFTVATGEQLLEALEQINNLEDGAKATIELAEDVQYDNPTNPVFTLSGEKEVTVDLKGNNFSINNTQDSNCMEVKDGATLTLTDTNEEKGALVLMTEKESEADEDFFSQAISVTNATPGTTTTLNIQNIDIEFPDTQYLWSTNTIFAKADDGAKSVVNLNEGSSINIAAQCNMAVCVDDNAECNMNGGKIHCEYNANNQMACVWGVYLQSDSAVFNMNDGIIELGGAHSCSGIYLDRCNGTVNMKGGTINVETTGGYGIGIEDYSYNKNVPDNGPSINMNGGVINVKATGGHGVAISANDKCTVTVGKGATINVFTSIYSENIAFSCSNLTNNGTVIEK